MTIKHTHPVYDSERARHVAIQSTYNDLLVRLKPSAHAPQALGEKAAPRSTA